MTPIVQQLVGRTRWGALDYLIVDMPPGTGDVQLTLSQDFRVSAAVLVTTPQRLSFVDVVKGVEMFDKVGIPTIAVVENMSRVRLSQLEKELDAILAHLEASAAKAGQRQQQGAPAAGAALRVTELFAAALSALATISAAQLIEAEGTEPITAGDYILGRIKSNFAK